MEQLDPEDGLAIWDFTEGSELPGGNLAVERLGIGVSSETWLVWNPGLWSPAVLKLARPHKVRPPRPTRTLHRETAALAGNLLPALRRLLGDGTSDPVPERAAMGIMGWSSTAMAARYQHMTDPIRQDIAKRVGGLLWAQPEADADDDDGALAPA